jgi:hypothetical protein
MQRAYKTIQTVSQHDDPVLHLSGARKDRPFVPVDCSSLVGR